MPSSKLRARRVGHNRGGFSATRFLEWLRLGQERQARIRKHSLRRGRIRYDENREKIRSRERYIRHKRNRARGR